MVYPNQVNLLRRHQAIIWTNGGILSIRTLGTNFSEILSEIHIYSFNKMHLKMPSAKWRKVFRDLNVSNSITYWPFRYLGKLMQGRSQYSDGWVPAPVWFFSVVATMIAGSPLASEELRSGVSNTTKKSGPLTKLLMLSYLQPDIYVLSPILSVC